MTVIRPPSSLYRFSATRVWLVEPGVEAAADVDERHAGLGQGVQVVERRRLRHEAAQGRVLGVDAGDLVRVLDGPGVSFPGRRPGAFQHRLPGEAVVDEPLVGRVPLLPHRAGLRGQRGDDDVEALGEQGLVDRGVPADRVRPGRPRAFPGRRPSGTITAIPARPHWLSVLAS